MGLKFLPSEPTIQMNTSKCTQILRNETYSAMEPWFLFCSKVHRAVIRSPKILSLVGNSLSVGQRVYLAGDLRATNFVNSENQNRQFFHVHVNEIYASKLSDSGANTDGESSRPVDHNSVFILAHIASEIQHSDNFSRFFVATHHTPK